MAVLSYTMHDRVTPAPQAVRAPDLARRFGRDVKFAVDTEVDPAGRYVMVESTAALRQAVYHVLVTEPGAYRRYPNYGVGLLRYLGKPLTVAAVDEIKNRISAGLLQLRRVDAVREVAVAQPDAYTLQAQIAVSAAGRLVRFQPFDFRR